VRLGKLFFIWLPRIGAGEPPSLLRPVHHDGLAGHAGFRAALGDDAVVHGLAGRAAVVEEAGRADTGDIAPRGVGNLGQAVGKRQLDAGRRGHCLHDVNRAGLVAACFPGNGVGAADMGLRADCRRTHGGDASRRAGLLMGNNILD